MTATHALAIVFDQAMDRDTVEAALSISPTTPHDIEWPSANHLVCHARGGWVGEQYTITLTSEIMTASGTPMGAEWQLTFGTGGRGAPVPVLMYHHILDLDADAKAETRQDYGMWRARPNLPERPDAKIRISHEDAEWLVDLRYSQLAVQDGVAQPYIRWSVTKGSEFYAWFINGRVKFHTDPTAAAAADPIRLGPPFHFQTGTRTRGRQALVNIGLKDANGCTLRLARKDGRQVQPTLKLLMDAEEVFQTAASYG